MREAHAPSVAEAVPVALAAIAPVAAAEEMRKHLVIATRGSALALWQANHVKGLLELENPEYSVSLNVIKTKGDLFQAAPLSKVGGKGLFVKEIEEAVLSGRADLAVHSMKDVPINLADGLILGCALKRDEDADCFLSESWPDFHSLPPGAIVGTSSLRRQAQLLALRPDLRVENLRGNIDTRLAKLKNGNYDAIILATAGLWRLGLSATHTRILPKNEFLPSVGQGALGIECREDNYDLLVMLASLEDRHTRVCVSAERAFLKTLNGGCQVPIAGHAEMLDEETVTLEGLVATPDGKQIFRAKGMEDASLAEKLGEDIARQTLAKGAKPILENLYSA